jgi:ABC-2 type transport system permease protein
MSLAISLVAARETGVLRRRQATPQPRWIVVAARFMTSLVTTATIAGLVLTLGRFAYGATVPVSGLPALATAVVIGSVAGCALAFAAASAIRAFDSAQPVVTAMAMPLFFISGVFVPWPLVPSWLRQVAELFPVRHLSQALLMPFVHAGTSAWSFTDLVVLAAWGGAGLTIALRRFRWAPRDA